MSIRFKTAPFATARRRQDVRVPVPCPACGRVLDSLGVSKVDDLLTAHRTYSCDSS